MKHPLRQLMSTRKNWRFLGVLYFQMSSVVKCNVGKIKRTTYRKFTGSQISRVAKASMPLIFHDKKSSAYNNLTGYVEANLNPGVAPSLVTGADVENGRSK